MDIFLLYSLILCVAVLASQVRRVVQRLLPWCNAAFCFESACITTPAQHWGSRLPCWWLPYLSDGSMMVAHREAIWHSKECAQWCEWCRSRSAIQQSVGPALRWRMMRLLVMARCWRKVYHAAWPEPPQLVCSWEVWGPHYPLTSSVEVNKIITTSTTTNDQWSGQLLHLECTWREPWSLSFASG